MAAKALGAIVGGGVFACTVSTILQDRAGHGVALPSHPAATAIPTVVHTVAAHAAATGGSHYGAYAIAAGSLVVAGLVAAVVRGSRPRLPDDDGSPDAPVGGRYWFIRVTNVVTGEDEYRQYVDYPSPGPQELAASILATFAESMPKVRVKVSVTPSTREMYESVPV